MFLRQAWKYTYNYSTYRVLVKNLRKTHLNIQCRKLGMLYTQFHNSPVSSFEFGQIREFSDISVSNTNFDSEHDVDACDEHDIDSDDGSFCLKTLLYNNPKDILLQSLNDCSNEEELFRIFNDRKEQFELQHMVQVVILLWDKFKNGSISKPESFNSAEIFNEFLNYLNCFVPNMNANESACCFQYLSKIGVDAGHPTMRNLILKTRDAICMPNTPLSALSRFTKAVNVRDDVHTLLVCKEVIPVVVHRLETCRNAEELRLITICLHNLVLFVSRDILQIYRSKIKELINLGELNSTSIKCILKILNLLTFPHWTHENAQLIRDLLLMIEDKISNLSLEELEILFRVFQNQMEPALFVPKLLKAAEELYERNQTLELFSCIVQFSQTNKREEFASKAKAVFIKELETSSQYVFPTLFKILRSLKTSDTDLCNMYWSRVLSHILNNPEERHVFRLLKHCHRYMHFNNNLGGTYRHMGFEKALCKILITEISKGTTSIIPSKFARLSSFVLAYGHTENSHKKFPDYIVDKIEEMATQFNILDCLFMSRGLQIALELRFKKDVPAALASQLVRIENVMNNCAERHLDNNLSIAELNFIVRSLNNRKCSRKIPLYQKAMDKYKHLDDELNSRVIRDITFNLTSASYVIPEILEKIWEYVVKNRNYVMGDTVQKILNCSYNLGFMPAKEDALHWSAEIIKRDFDYMTGLSIVQACLALCFYRAIPESLVNKVFCIDFIKRLEDEIQFCYSKAVYPERVLNQVMQLNRAVCLDYPECRVPWFQQNYIEAQMTKKPVVQTRFHSDIKNLLVSIVKDEKFLRCNHVTPYGYIVDFVLHLDRNKQPISAPKEAAIIDKITKVAILPLRFESFCENDPKSVRGPEHLRMRHLEILGYKVIHINFSEWNAMYMNVPGAKVNYLKSLLQIE